MSPNGDGLTTTANLSVYDAGDEQFCNEALAREYESGPRFGLANLFFLLGMGLVLACPFVVVMLTLCMIVFCRPEGCGI